MKVNLIYLLIALILLSSCQDKNKDGKVLSTPTSGVVKIGVDASLAPLLDAEIKAFEATYQNTKIEVVYKSEEEIMSDFSKDSIKLAFITRPLSQTEEKILEELHIKPQTLVMASEGIAIITHKENTEDNLNVKDLRRILQEKATQWKDVYPGTNQSAITVVFNQPNSSMVRFLQDSVGGFNSLPSYCFGLKGDTAVIHYVSQNKNAIGLIGASWISDRDDVSTNTFLKTIKVLSLNNDSTYFQPYQAYVAQGSYPLIRNIYMISREARAGLASGFMAYIASDKGQRIVLKIGLVPETMPVRVVEINQEPIQ